MCSSLQKSGETFVTVMGDSKVRPEFLNDVNDDAEFKKSGFAATKVSYLLDGVIL